MNQTWADESGNQRCYPHPMGKRRAEHSVDDGSFLEWMDTSERQQSIEAYDLVFDALEHAGLDSKQRKIVWHDRNWPSIEQSVERIHALHPDVPRDQTESHVCGWLEI